MSDLLSRIAAVSLTQLRLVCSRGPLELVGDQLEISTVNPMKAMHSGAADSTNSATDTVMSALAEIANMQQ